MNIEIKNIEIVKLKDKYSVNIDFGGENYLTLFLNQDVITFKNQTNENSLGDTFIENDVSGMPIYKFEAEIFS
jgi:hypothetical protein